MLAPRGHSPTPRGHSPTPDPEQGGQQHHLHSHSHSSHFAAAAPRPRLQSRDPQAKYARRWTSSLRVFMYHRRHLVLLLLLLALVAGGSAVLTTARRQQQGRGADEDEGSSGGQAAALAAEGLGLGGSMKNGQGQGQGQGGERSVVEAALAAKRPKGGRAEEARRWRKEELLEELKELEGLLEGEEDLAELEEAFLEAGEAEEEQEADDDDDEARAAQAREEAWSARLGGAMEKMRQRKQALKEYAASAQRAADDVRRQAGQPAHDGAKGKGKDRPLKPAPPSKVLADGATPPPRDRSRGLWSDAAVAWTREHWLAGRTAEEEAALTKERREAVREAVLHAWGGYKQFAWGMDELQPVSQKGQNWFGLGLTLVDSLDLLWLMGEKAEFQGALEWVAKELDPSVNAHVNVFEVTIRVVGGLLAAYHLSGEEAFLGKAKQLGENLRPAMESPSGVPWSDAVLADRRAFAPASAQDSSVSEATSIQLEFKSLAHALDDEVLYRLAERSMRAVDRARSDLPPGEMSALVPMFINARTGAFNTGSTITLGARGDSYYEYLLKQWLLTGKRDGFYRDVYNEAIAAIRAKLLRHSEPRGLAYIAELQNGRTFSPKMDHLVCYLPGTLALGAHHGLDESHLAMAKDLMASCFAFYNSTATGLAPEIAYFTASHPDAEAHPEFDLYIQPRDTHNILRPETVESLFYLWRVTKDPVYREWGWRIFAAFERHSKIPSGGFSGLQNVNSLDDPRTDRMDKMESFFLGETLKYFVLLFGDDDLLSLDDYVLNTEAHPLPVFAPRDEWLAEKPEAEWYPQAAQQQQHEQEGEGPMAPLAVDPHAAVLGEGGSGAEELKGALEALDAEEEEEDHWEEEEEEEEDVWGEEEEEEEEEEVVAKELEREEGHAGETAES